METSPYGRLLWQHSDPQSTIMYKFKSHIASRYGLKFGSETEPNSLWNWSVTNTSSFWGEVWSFTRIKSSKLYDTVVNENSPMFPRPAFFAGAKLNFAENLLYPDLPIDPDSTAVISANEFNKTSVSWKQLREMVRECAASMRNYVKIGDRIAGYLANDTTALVAMLAATSLGCIWTGISPDHGPAAVLDRLGQLEPVLLFASNAVLYNGKFHDVIGKLKDIITNLSCLKAVVVVETCLGHPTLVENLDVTVISYKNFLEKSGDNNRTLVFEQLDPDHPVYILFSSGTTGKPKCICHGAVGTLIQHKKEHFIQADMKPGDVFFQFTTVTWMMWHWLVSALACGVTIVLYDGSPFRPLVDGHGELTMFKLMEEIGVTHFGTSAKYLSVLEQNNTKPKKRYSLEKLKAIYSTAAVLAPSTFEYVYRVLGPNIQLASITGGTDIISLFGVPSTLVPVYSGEIQCIGLGMKVEAWDRTGKNLDGTNEAGDLVCTKPFPSMPVKFWGAEGEITYKNSYFTEFPGVWHHGDFVKINDITKGLQMLGRSDGILKPAGVRFGSAEIYNILLNHFPNEFEDALCIGRRRPRDLDEIVVLFTKMSPAHGPLNEQLIDRVKSIIRKELSQRHIPAIICETPEIPVTTNGKKVEVVVKQILCGTNVKISASVANPDCLKWYREWAENN